MPPSGNPFTPFDQIQNTPGLGKDERLCLSATVVAIEKGGRKIASLLRQGPILGITGSTDTKNIQGEEVQTMDQIAQNIFLTYFQQSGAVQALLSEESEFPALLPVRFSSPCLVAMDPLDGSSNLSVNASVGSIFAIFRPARDPRAGVPSDTELFNDSASGLFAACYLLYSVSTSLVLAINGEVHVYTLDPSTGEFVGNGTPVQFPDGGKIYSVNEAYYPSWEAPLQEYIQWVKTDRKPTMILRYIGALVGDFHRNLLKGGIYLYPPDASDRVKASGKLRLLYEAYPMAFIARAAGGMATDGHRPILEIRPNSYHQRIPLVVGPSDLIREFQSRIGAPVSS